MSDETDLIRILHVDDDPGFAELAATYLQRNDDRFDIESGSSADDGLDRLDGAAFDCVVSDHDMPGRNGIEFLEAVRDEYPDLPFILFTGKGRSTPSTERERFTDRRAHNDRTRLSDYASGANAGAGADPPRVSRCERRALHVVTAGDPEIRW